MMKVFPPFNILIDFSKPTLNTFPTLASVTYIYIIVILFRINRYTGKPKTHYQSHKRIVNTSEKLTRLKFELRLSRSFILESLMYQI